MALLSRSPPRCSCGRSRRCAAPRPRPTPCAGSSVAPMKPKNQRLILVSAALVAVLVAVLLAMWGLRSQASYFYTPAEIAAGKAAPGKAVRLGGMVEKGSIQRQPDGITIHFVLTDGQAR